MAHRPAPQRGLRGPAAALAALALVALGAAPGYGQTKPGFDCAKAATAVEKAVCNAEHLSWRDGALARLYAGLRRGLPDAGRARLRHSQRAWLADRDRACPPARLAEAAGGYTCLTPLYDRRLIELATQVQRAELTTAARNRQPPLAGLYEKKATGFRGSVLVLEMPDDAVWALISTVAGPTFHTCDVSITSGRRFGRTVVWRGDKDAVSGKTCRIVMTFVGDGVEVADNNACRTYCGARGFFTTSYRRSRGVQ